MRLSLASAFALVLVACGGNVVADPCETFAGCQDPAPTPRPEPAPTPAPTPSPIPAPEPPARQEQRGPESCPAPYHVATDDDRCVWSCSEGTQPDPTGGIECTCTAGLTEVDTDRFGRRVCR